MVQIHRLPLASTGRSYTGLGDADGTMAAPAGGATVTVVVPAEPIKPADPPNNAVMVSVPTGSWMALMVSAALADPPDAESVAVPSELSFNRKVTSPAAVPPDALTVAVSFTLPLLNPTLPGVAVTVVVVDVPLA